MKQSLRPFQERAIERLRASHAKNPILVAPTGAGKTTIAAHLVMGAVERGRRVLFLAHRKELIDQAATRFMGHGVQCGIIKAGITPNPTMPVQVASVQTLINRDPPHADIVIVDECHHANAETYKTILGWFPKACRIGLTATPFRTDGSGLGDCGFGEIIVAATPKELIDQGFLMRPRVFVGDPIEGLDKVRTVAGDYGKKGLSLIMTQSPIVGDIIAAWNYYAEDRPTIAFASSIEHSKLMVSQFGDIARHLDGETPEDEREQILGDLADGKVKIVSNYGVLPEGWDMPSAAVCILARPTKSLGLYMQMAGRIMRPLPGKDTPIILDHGECTERHGFVDQHLEFSLDGEPRHGATLGFKNCPKCFVLLPSTCKSCPYCGEDITREVERKVKGLGIGGMKELTPQDLERDYYVRRLEEGGRFKIGWARHRFKTKFGYWPSYYDLEKKHYQPFGEPLTRESLSKYCDLESLWGEVQGGEWGRLCEIAARIRSCARSSRATGW